MFNKGQCIGHIEPSIHHMPQTDNNSLTTQKILDEHIQPDSFTSPLHKLPDDVRKSLNQLLETFKSQFAHDETSIGTIHLLVLFIKHYNWVRNEMNKLLDAHSIHNSHSTWSAPIIVVPVGDGGKHLVINYRALNQVTWKFMWPMPRVEDIFSKLNSPKYFSPLVLCAGYYHIPLDEDSIPKTAFYISFWKI